MPRRNMPTPPKRAPKIDSRRDKKRKEGYYVVVEFGGTPATVAELDRILGLADEVLRFKIQRLSAKHAPKRVAAKA